MADWLKDVTPSAELREWFDHNPGRWDEFRERYRSELDDRPEQVQELHEYARFGNLALLYSTTDEEHNNAIVLADYLTDQLDEE
ncbi:MAG: DUF488 domain-containing protein [Halorhabdus sp.]